MKYEESFSKLNEIKDKLEDSELPLDEAIKLYSKSVGYTKTCLDTLKETEGKIMVIKSELDGLVEKPLDVEE